VRICFDPATLHQSKRGAVTGVVYFEFSPEKQFPGAGWNDFVVVLTNWWIAALDQIIAGRPQADLLFMDGPYWITANSQGKDLTLTCTEDRDAGVTYNVVVQLDDLKRELSALAREVAVSCQRKGFKSSEVDKLGRYLPN
jgi:hypothetical protein